jgi:hypothetical protein
MPPRRATWRPCRGADTASSPRCKPGTRRPPRPLLPQTAEAAAHRHCHAARPAPPPLAAARSTSARAALIVVLFVAVRLYWLATSVRPARLVQVVQLTQTGRVELGTGVATDGTRVYFTQRDGGRWSLAQVSVEGGTPLPLPLPLEQPLSNPDILDISPDRSNLLVASGSGTEPERRFGWSPRWADRRGAWGMLPATRAPGRATETGSSSPAAPRCFWSRATARIPASFSTPPAFPTPSAGRPHPERMCCAFPCSVRTWGRAPCGKSPPGGTGLHPLLRDWNSGAAEPDGDDNGELDRQWKLLSVPRAPRPRVQRVCHARASPLPARL